MLISGSEKLARCARTLFAGIGCAWGRQTVGARDPKAPLPIEPESLK